jgi:RES domain-containing protein
MPTGWRLVKARHAAQAFDGEGARRYGGRWNSPGIRMVYTSQSRSLAVLEILVHLNHSTLLSSYVFFSVEFDASLVSSLDRSRLPDDWRSNPAPPGLQILGDEWVRGRHSVVLEVPSAVVEEESHYLINPDHPDFAALAISRSVPFELDLRLVQRAEPA